MGGRGVLGFHPHNYNKAVKWVGLIGSKLSSDFSWLRVVMNLDIPTPNPTF